MASHDSSLVAPSASAARPRLGRALLAGLGSGLLGGLAGVAAWLLQGANPGTATAPFGPGPIMAASVVLNLAGGMIFYGLARWLARPATPFRLLGLALATVYSAALFGEPSLAPIAVDATVLHYVVAAVALVAIPRLALASTGRSGATVR